VTAAGGLPGEQAPFGGVVADEDMDDVTKLSSRRAGLGGIVCTSPLRGGRGARVKRYPGRPGRDAPCRVVTLQSPPGTITMGRPASEARRMERSLLARVEPGRDALLSGWNDGLGWTEEEHDAFRASLKRLP
jgi:hypothetical protein